MTAERIKFYLDEQAPRAIAIGLRQRGIDVLTAQEAGMKSATDEQQAAFALREKRVIFTQDADFLRIRAEGLPHVGIVYASQRTAIGTIVRGLMLIHDVLSPNDMADHLEFV